MPPAPPLAEDDATAPPCPPWPPAPLPLVADDVEATDDAETLPEGSTAPKTVGSEPPQESGARASRSHAVRMVPQNTHAHTARK